MWMFFLLCATFSLFDCTVLLQMLISVDSRQRLHSKSRLFVAFAFFAFNRNALEQFSVGKIWFTWRPRGPALIATFFNRNSLVSTVQAFRSEFYQKHSFMTASMLIFIPNSSKYCRKRLSSEKPLFSDTDAESMLWRDVCNISWNHSRGLCEMCPRAAFGPRPTGHTVEVLALNAQSDHIAHCRILRLLVRCLITSTACALWGGLAFQAYFRSIVLLMLKMCFFV